VRGSVGCVPAHVLGGGAVARDLTDEDRALLVELELAITEAPGRGELPQRSAWRGLVCLAARLLAERDVAWDAAERSAP